MAETRLTADMRRVRVATKRIDVRLTEDDIRFIKWMAERDRVPVSEELRMIFRTELEKCKELYEGEMEAEING